MMIISITKTLYFSFLVIVAITSLIENALIVPIDYHIDSSQTGPYGGIFGTSFWFTQPERIVQPQVVDELKRWKDLNFYRGLFGVLAWVLCQMSGSFFI